MNRGLTTRRPQCPDYVGGDLTEDMIGHLTSASQMALGVYRQWDEENPYRRHPLLLDSFLSMSGQPNVRGKFPKLNSDANLFLCSEMFSTLQWELNSAACLKMMSKFLWGLFKACPTIWNILQQFDRSNDLALEMDVMSTALQAAKETIQNEFNVLATIIRRDVLKILYEDRGLNSDNVSSMDIRRVDSELDKVGALVKCISCKKVLVWSGVPDHACLTNDPGYETYDNFVRKKKKAQRCVAAGWRPERIASTDGLAESIFGLLSQRVMSAIQLDRGLDPESALPDRISALYTSEWQFECEISDNTRFCRNYSYMSPVEAVSLSSLRACTVMRMQEETIDRT